jgi:rubrerythrin
MTDPDRDRTSLEPPEVIAEAIQAEKEAEWFYTMTADMTTDEEVRQTLLKLAREEASHARMLVNLHFEMTGHGVLDPPSSPPEGGANLFDFSTANQRDVLEYALQRETNAIELYQRRADRAGHAKIAGVFRHLADAELEHAAYLRLLLARIIQE